MGETRDVEIQPKEGIDYFEGMKNSTASRKMGRLDGYDAGLNMNILGIVCELSRKYNDGLDLHIIFSDRLNPLLEYFGILFELCDDIEKVKLEDSIDILSRPKGIFSSTIAFELKNIFIKSNTVAKEEVRSPIQEQ